MTRRSLISSWSPASSVVPIRLRTSSSSTSAALEGVLQPRRHRRLLEERQDGDELLVAEHAAGGRRRRLLVGQQQRQTDQLRSILGLGAGLLGDRGRREVAEAERAVGMGDDAVEVESAVDDAGVVQPAEVVPQRRDAGRSRSTAHGALVECFRQRLSFRSDDDEGVAPPCAAGRHQPRHAHAGSLGEQRDEPFVLDEVDAAASGATLTTSIPGHPPQRREQLGIPRVAPVHLDEQRSVPITPLEQHDPGPTASPPARGRRRTRRARRGPP